VEARVAVIVSAALLAIGVLLRVYFYADRRSLWLDEVWLALNIVTRSAAGLTRPLDFSQSAPLGFLWVEHLAARIGGVNELALRAFPLLAGCLLLVGLWMIARRLMGASGAALCLALASLSPLMIYYSNEVKPYITDALFAVVVMWLALDVLDAPDSRRAWVRLAVCGAVAILFSTPSIFMLAGAGMALVASPRIRSSRAGWLRLVVTGAAWVAMFAAGYLTIYRSTATSDYMQRIWSDSFLSLPPRYLLYGLHQASRSFFNESLLAQDEVFVPRKANTLIAIFSAIGTIWLLRKRGLPVTLLLVAPCVAVFVASFAHRWPLVPRLMVFLVPTLTLLVAAGAVAAVQLIPPRTRGIVLAALGIVMIIPAAQWDAYTVQNPRRRDDIAPLIRELRANRSKRNGSIVYVMGHAVVPWVYYTARWSQKEGATFRYATTRANTAEHFATRACIEQEPGLRAVFGGMGKGMDSDSTLAAEAAWLAAQPERDVWLLAITYEHKLVQKMDAQMAAHGATRTLERSRSGADMIRYQFPADSSRVVASCDS
jgi:hypothetical protein